MNRLKILSQEEIQSIHEATLRILAEVGFVWTHQESLEILIGAGCTQRGNRVLFPPHLVEECIKKSGKRATIKGRGGIRRTLGDGNLYFHNLGGARDIFDATSGSRRPAHESDVSNAARLLDALENCHTVTPFFTPLDVPGELMSLFMYRHTIPHTLKPIQGPGVQYRFEIGYALEMAAVIDTEPGALTLSLSPVSPLTIPDHEAEAVVEMAKAGVAFATLPCPTAGATSPMTIAGSLAQQNAETLAIVVLSQIVNPGLSIIYCGRLGMLEPRTGLIWGGLELGMASAATVQLGHFYGYSVNVYGFSTNAHTLDAQNGFERGLNAVLPALAGADELSGIGEMEAGVMGSFAQMVMDNELAGQVLRLRRGIEVDRETLALEGIMKAMDGTRNFLGQRHTMNHLRTELNLTRLAERNTWEAWDKAGREGMAEHAAAEAERILREHRVPPLDPRQERELDRIMSAAARDQVRKGSIPHGV
jgi:trimethylamine--corrinoid protein Co-methyltransferase